MADVILEGNVAYLKGAKASVHIMGLNRPVGGKADGGKVKEMKPEKYADSKPWAVWGDDDNWPELVREDVKYSIMLSRGIQSKAKMLYANGIMTYKLQYDENGKESIMPVRDLQFEQWAEASYLNHQIQKAAYHHEYYNNPFPKLIFSKDKKKVNKIVWEKPRYCRWEKIDGTKGKIKNCYVSAWFDQFVTANDKDKVKVMPAINIYDDMQQVMDDDTRFEYMFRSMYPLSDNDYYAVPAWNSARESGWVEVEKRVPELKKYMFTNNINIRWHIQIPYDHWENKYGKDTWANYDAKQKQEKILEQLKDINDFLAGSENSYKAFISHFGVDPISKQAQPGWKIEKLESGMDKSEFLEDVDQANLEISYALGWDLALSGQSGKSLGAGSGSDKREAFLIYTSMLRMDRDFLLMPLYWIKHYNGWDPELKFGFRDVVLTTLDKNPTGSEKVVSN